MTTLGELQKRLVQVYTQNGKDVLDFTDDLASITNKGFSREMALINLALQNNIEIKEVRDMERRGLSREEAMLRFSEELEKAQDRERKFSETLRSVPSEGIVRPTTNPSSVWYLLPLALGLIGGLIAYVYVRDDDPEMAKDLFTVGLIVNILTAILFYMFIL